MRSASESESDMKPLKKVDKIVLMVAAALSTLKMIEEMLLMVKMLLLSMV